MSAVHIHLLITHLPIFGSLIGALVLIYGMLTKNTNTKSTAYLVLILAAIGGTISYFTGEGAEHVARKIEGISKHAIHEHEEAGEFAIITIIILGLASLVALYVTKLKAAWENKASWMVLFLALICFGATARTGFLGGKIRHPEADGTVITTNLPSEEQHEDD